MSHKHHKKPSPLLIACLVIVTLLNLGLLIAFLLRGTNVALFNPKGLIADEQFRLLIYTVVVILIVMVPTLFVAFFMAWKYRETRAKAAHNPSVKHGKGLVFVMWLIPIFVSLVVSSAMIPATHNLAPQKSIAADDNTLTVQVISLNWKWLFLYPEQGIATVNFMQIPVDTPVEFELTADESPMSSFWVPNLGGQLYTMTGMVNRLNLIADTPGDYPGSSAEINGRGFAGMKFTVRVSTLDDFDTWVKEVKQSPNILDDTAYQELVKPSQNNPVTLFSAFEDGLYDEVVMKYIGPEGHGH